MEVEPDFWCNDVVVCRGAGAVGKAAITASLGADGPPGLKY